MKRITKRARREAAAWAMQAANGALSAGSEWGVRYALQNALEFLGDDYNMGHSEYPRELTEPSAWEVASLCRSAVEYLGPSSNGTFDQNAVNRLNRALAAVRPRRKS